MEPEAIAVYMKSLVTSEGWGAYADLIENLVKEHTEELLMLRPGAPDDYLKGMVRGLRDAMAIPERWVEWRKQRA